MVIQLCEWLLCQAQILSAFNLAFRVHVCHTTHNRKDCLVLSIWSYAVFLKQKANKMQNHSLTPVLEFLK